jgi:NitT/TauT family transport system ATP-binding protein
VLDPVVDGRSGQIAFVFQQPALLPWRTALENVTLPLQLIGRGRPAERDSVAREMLATVGLGDALDRFPHQLSGGMKMRVSIARALITQPSVLLLDEPFAALDDMLRNQLGQLFLRLWQERQFTAIMVTHNIAESILLSHRIGVMQGGRLVNTIENPLPSPRNESLRRSPEFGRFYGQVSDALRGET